MGTKMEEKILKKNEVFLNEWKEREIFKEIDEFHKKRIEKLKKDETPIPFKEGGKIVFYLIPVEFCEHQKYYDISNLNTRIRSLNLNKLLSYDQTYNFDSLFYFRMPDRKCYEYIQIFTNGIIEAVDSRFYSPEDKVLYILDIERELISKTKDSLMVQKELGIKPPIFFYLDLLNIMGCSIKSDRFKIFYKKKPIYMEDLNFPIEIINKLDIEVEKMLKASFDRLWNACGYPGSPYYDESGERTE